MIITRLIGRKWFLTDNAVYLSKDSLESLLHIGSLKSRCLNERKAFLLSITLSILSCNRTEMFQIGFVSNQHDDNVSISVISQFLKPSADIVECNWFGHIVDKKSTKSTAIVGAGDRSVTFLSGGVPYLSFNGFWLDLPINKCVCVWACERVSARSERERDLVIRVIIN